MIRKRNGFFNFCCSCTPGAGQMCQGFMKRGLSIMSIFFATLLIATMMEMDEFTLILPVIWFFSFFDSMNSNAMDEHARRTAKAEFLFVDRNFDLNNIFKKFRVVIAVVLILFGAKQLLNMFQDVIIRVFNLEWYYVNYVGDTIIKAVISVAIIALGLYLIKGKKKEMFEDPYVADATASDNTDFGENNDEHVLELINQAHSSEE